MLLAKHCIRHSIVRSQAEKNVLTLIHPVGLPIKPFLTSDSPKYPSLSFKWPAGINDPPACCRVRAKFGLFLIVLLVYLTRSLRLLVG